jgi:hypothetical protein
MFAPISSSADRTVLHQLFLQTDGPDHFVQAFSRLGLPMQHTGGPHHIVQGIPGFSSLGVQGFSTQASDFFPIG